MKKKLFFVVLVISMISIQCINAQNFTVSTTPTSICAGSGNSVAVQSTYSGPLTPMSYLWSNGVTGNIPAITVNPTITTTYSVTVIFNDFTNATANTVVTVNPLPVVTFNPPNPNTCPGGSVLLFASGGTSYHWDNGVTTISNLITPMNNTNCSVTVTDGNGCSKTASTIVVVDPLPTAGATASPTNVCPGGSSLLTASGGSTYLWSNNLGTSNQVTVSPTVTTTYTVTATNGSGCIDVAHTVVTIIPLPSDTIVVTGLANVCSPGIVALHVNTNAINPTYQWQLNGNNIFGATIANYTATQTGLYTAIVTNNSGCSNLDNQMVNIYALPTAGANAFPTNICPGGSSLLTASGGNTYLWSNNLGTSNQVTVSPTATTTYVVTVTNNNGCSATTATTVTIDPVPGVVINPPASSICPNVGSVTFTASNGISYVWNNGLGTNNQITISPTVTTTYTVTATNNSGCTTSTNAVVTVNPVPIASVAPSLDTICVGGNSTLTASGGGTYSWSNGLGTSNQINVSPSITSIYTVTVTNNFGCSAVANAGVNVNPLPVAFNVGSVSNPFCQGGSGATITLSGSEIGVSYQLKLGTTIIGTLNGTGNALNFTGIATVGTYTIVATNTSTSCTQPINGSVVVTMSLLPVSANAIISNNGNTVFCQNTTAVFSTTNITNASFYVWSVPNGATIVSGQGNNQITVDFNNAVSGTISVFGQNACGGGQSSSLAITINPAPSLIATANPVFICAGDNSTLTATVTGVGNTFLWSTTANTQITLVSPAVTSTYYVTVTGANGCSAQGNVTVNVHPLPVVGLTLFDDQFCTDVNSAVLAGGSPLGGTYTGGTYVVIFSGNTIFPATIPVGTYPIMYTYIDGNGCDNSAQDLLTINPVPAVIFDNIPGPIYTDTPPFDLTSSVSPIGGIFAGPGIMSGSSIFNPAMAGVGNHMITYTYTHPITGCSASQIQYIIVGPSTGIDNIAAANAVVIYPNPATNQLNLSGIDTKKIISLQVTDIIGQTLYATTTLSENMTINVSNFAPGTYIISFINADGISIGRRFIKTE